MTPVSVQGCVCVCVRAHEEWGREQSVSTLRKSLPEPLYNQLLKAGVYRERIPGSGLRLDQAATNHVETV